MFKDILSKNDYNLFQKQFPDKSVEEIEKLEKYVMDIYKNSVQETKRVIERGFTDNYKKVNLVEWVYFVGKIMPKIEKIKNMKVGKDKLELLLSYSTFIIIKSLPIDPVLKEMLVNIIKDQLPLVAEGIVYATKHMHTFIIKIFKKFKGMFSCFKKQEEN